MQDFSVLFGFLSGTRIVVIAVLTKDILGCSVDAWSQEGGYSHKFGWGCAAGFMKVLTFSVLFGFLSGTRIAVIAVLTKDILECNVDAWSQEGGYSHKFGWGCAAGFMKVLIFTRPNFANFVTPYQTKNAQLFLTSVFFERSH